jgi:CBS domain containing-hemolysin-like protein
MRTGGEKIAIVTGLPHHGKLPAAGIVTITDLVEELTGELA